ncbi:MAG: hypothetical protein CK547_03225 [Chitinophagaceae bacterium]|nr:MAG: hypothetical protein CK547_03225 [Chitinophagaceae bacterium]
MSNTMRLYLILFALVTQFNLNAQSADTSTIESLIREISSLQSLNNTDFPDGGFSSYRKYQFSSIYKADYNFFYTALILFNLQRYNAYLTQEERLYVGQIKARALPYFELFKSKIHGNSYNFWQKDPPMVFPNSGWLNRYNQRNALPDDIDDCAIGMLAIGPKDSSLGTLKDHFLYYRNGNLKYTKGFYKQYKQMPVYSTWLGKDFPIDIDLCVLSNVMLMNAIYKLPLNNTDSTSLDLLVAMIKDGRHMTSSKYVSQHYENSSTIIYHVARLISYSDYTPLLALRSSFVLQAKELLKKSDYAMEKLLLHNALLQLGERGIEAEEISREALLQRDYPFFVANMASMLANPYKQIFTSLKIGRFSYYSYPFNLSLLYENKILRERVNK